jgi:hypothetical protein
MVRSSVATNLPLTQSSGLSWCSSRCNYSSFAQRAVQCSEMEVVKRGLAKKIEHLVNELPYIRGAHSNLGDDFVCNENPPSFEGKSIGVACSYTASPVVVVRSELLTGTQ